MSKIESSIYTDRLERLFQVDSGEALKCRQRRFKEKEDVARARLLLWGCGALGNHIADVLKCANLSVSGFVDRKPELWGTNYRGSSIISPDSLRDKEWSDALVIVGIYTSQPLRELLSEWGISFLTFPELAWGLPEYFIPHQCLDRPDIFYAQPDEVRASLVSWADDASREEYLGQLEWRLTLDYEVLPNHMAAKETYFPGELVTLEPKEHFVDCGAFDGDSIRELLERTQGRFNKITAFEPDKQNYQRLAEYCRKTPSLAAGHIQLINQALGDKARTGFLSETGTVGSAVGTSGSEISVSTLDHVLANEVPTYLKMDIEGFEPLALSGGSNLIQKYRPVLAICLYHSFDHLWSIPNYLHSLVPDYNLYLRRHSDECWESVCYAIPSSRVKAM